MPVNDDREVDLHIVTLDRLDGDRAPRRARWNPLRTASTALRERFATLESRAGAYVAGQRARMNSAVHAVVAAVRAVARRGTATGRNAAAAVGAEMRALRAHATSGVAALVRAVGRAVYRARATAASATGRAAHRARALAATAARRAANGTRAAAASATRRAGLRARATAASATRRAVDRARAIAVTARRAAHGAHAAAATATRSAADGCARAFRAVPTMGKAVGSGGSAARVAAGRALRGVPAEVGEAAGSGVRAFTGRARAARDTLGTLGVRMGRAARRALEPAAYAAGGIALVLAAVLGWLESPPNRQPPRPVEVSIVGGSAAPVAVRPDNVRPDAVTGASAALNDPALAEQAKLAIVDGLSADARDAATEVLLSAARGDSLLVSMASLRALRGRPCARVAGPLARGLGHGEWQRRAWSAKVLGENHCAAAAPELRSRLARERDARVRRQLSSALSTLGPSAG